MAFDVHERSATGSESSVHLIDLTGDEQEAPFAVREADGSVNAVPGRIPDKAEILAWLEDHPVFVGIATGVLCFSIIAAAMSTVLGSDPKSDDPVAGAALSDADGGQGSFSSSGSGGANFTSDESKLSRTGAGKVPAESADGETAVGPSTKSNGQSTRNAQSTDPTTAGTSNLDQSATLGGRTPATGNGSGPAAGPVSSTTRPSGPNSNANPDRSGSPTTAGNTPSTLNPGPNVSGPATTTRTSTSTVATNPTTVTTARQTSSSSPSTVPTTAATTPSTVPTTAATTPTTPSPPTPVNLSIAAPGNGSSHSFETPTNFAANFVPGATQYCWTFIQAGATAREACSGSTTYQLPARPSNIDPGLVTIRLTATGPFGTLTDSIQISLYRTKVINNPTRDVTIGKGALRVGVINLAGATNYCFRLTQVGYDSGSLCYSTPGNTFNKHDPIWDSLSPGSLTVSAAVYGGGTLLASDSVTIQLLQ